MTTRKPRKAAGAPPAPPAAPVPPPAAIPRAVGSDGGVYDKIGNWYEEAAVVLHLLLVLWDQADSVTWEPPGTDGIDYQVVERGRRIAVQAKTRHTSPWSPSALTDPLGYARRWLDQDGTHWYRFQTDQKPQALKDAGETARSGMTDAAWLAEDADRGKYAAALGCDTDDPAGLARARDCFRRIEVEVTGKEVISARIRELALGLTRDDADTLTLGLMTVARTPAFLRRAHGAAALRQALDTQGVTVRWNGPVADRTTAPWLHDRREDFAHLITAARRGRAAIPRAEAPRIVTAVTAAALGGVILVHGAAGSGKSEVLHQAVEQLTQSGATVLPWRGDADPATLTEGERTPVRRLLAASAGGRACLVIDQLDQVAYIAQSNAVVRQWIRDALRAGIPVVVGCRTVDAHQDTHLHQLLFHQGVPTTTIEVGPLPDTAIQARLVPLGVPLADLGPDLLRLVRNPMLLGLVEDLVRQRGRWQGMTSLWEVVDAWCGQQGAETTAVLDALVLAMEREGSIAVHPDLVPGDWQRLVNAGILLRDGMGRLRTFHQLIADVRLARTWVRADTPADLLAHLGPRQRQGFREARRLRLCLPQIVARGPRGIELVRDLVFHDELRPLVRRAAFLGLAEVATIEPRMLRLMEEWLAEPQRRDPLLNYVVSGSQPWFEALTAWLDRAWIDRPDEEGILLDLCASVSLRCGDAVARHLRAWEQGRPGTLARARWIFMQNPSTDSDELFALRLDTVARDAEQPRTPVKWDELIERQPARAAALFMALVQRWTPPTGRFDEGPAWIRGWPDDLPAQLTNLPWSTWEPLWAWWRDRTLTDLRHVDLNHKIRPSLWLSVVRAMTQAAAVAMSSQETTWVDVRARLSPDLRNQDGWLLLCLGQRLRGGAVRRSDVINAIEWFMDDPRWARLAVGSDGRHTQAAKFLAVVAPSLDQATHERLQSWVCRYRDPWTAAQERSRYRLMLSGQERPNDRGLTAWTLLPALDRQRWTSVTASEYDLLNRKFALYALQPPLKSRFSGFGSVDSPIPPEALQAWSDDRWIRKIREVAEDAPSRTWRQTSAGTMTTHTLETHLDRLRDAAQSDPVRYVGLANALLKASPPVPEEAFFRLVSGLGEEFTSAHVPPRLDDAAFVALVDQPGYRDHPSCAMALAMLVEKRPDHQWPLTIVQRLRQIAEERVEVPSPEASSSIQPDELLHKRYGDVSCIALHALAAMAPHRHDLKDSLFDLAESLVEHPDAARRASVARLTTGCFVFDPGRCGRILLRLAEDPVVPAQEDLQRQYIAISANAHVAEPIRLALRQRLMRLCASNDSLKVAQAVGLAVVQWWAWGVLGHVDYRAVIANNPLARQEAAREIAAWMADPQMPKRILDEAINLANDEDPAVGSAIIGALTDNASSHLFRNTGLIAALAESTAVRGDLTDFIDGCDNQGSLLPVGSVLVNLGRRHTGAVALTSDWKDNFTRDQHADLLMRLHEEAQRSGDDTLATQALDALDALLVAGLSQSRLLAGLTSDELP